MEEDMEHHFNTVVINSSLSIKNMAQISTERPTVNWKFHDKTNMNLSAEFGSCGTHTVHNSFKAGVVATYWGASSLLSSLYYLFKDSPAKGRTMS